MANGNGKKGWGSPGTVLAQARNAKRAAAARSRAAADEALEKAPKGRLTGKKHAAHLKKLLGMTKRPTAAGQEKFGDVDVGGGGFRGAISDREAQMAKLQAQRLGSSARRGNGY